jgi:LuxR family maltose regulon positive regulatory protein
MRHHQIAQTDVSPIVTRRALCEAVLAATCQSPLTLIIAPPVSGKATLIAQVRQAMATQPYHRDPDRALVAIENFHSLQGEAQARVAADIELQIAKGVRYLITSTRRLDPMFSLLRLKGQVREFGLSDLALSEAEINEFLGPQLAPRLSARARHALMTRTEGWIGAWNVLRGLIRDGAAPLDLARTFSGRDRDLVAYFDQCVTTELSEETFGFLLQVSPLDRMSEAMGRDLTGRRDAALRLAEASTACGFVLDEDRNGDWRRLHPLFRDYLIGASQRRDPAAHRQSLCRAADHAEARQDWMTAARLHAEADNAHRAIEILRQFADDMITGQGDASSFRQLTASLSESQLSSLGAELALSAIFAGDFAGAASLVERTIDQAAPLSVEARTRLDAIRICVDFGLERFQRVRDEAAHWLERHPDTDPRYRAMVGVALFWSCHAAGDSHGAYKALGSARLDVGRARSPFLSGWLAIISATHKLEHGQVANAASVLAQGAGEGMIRSTADLVRAAVAWQRVELDEVRHLVAQSLDRGARHSVVETSLMGWEAAARMALHDQGLAAALRCLGEAESVVAARHGERARRLVRLARARLVLQCPGEDALSGLGVELASVCNDEIARGLCRSYAERARLTLARHEARRGDPRRAISLLQPIQAAALKVSRLLVWGEASLIYAGALARQDDQKRALRIAWPAIRQLAGGGYMAAIADEHLLLSPLVDALLAQSARGTDREYRDVAEALDRLAARCGRPAPMASELSLLEPEATPSALTEMERRVLSLAAEGCSNAQIAERTLTQLTTVKWHMHNIFAKLAVRSRTAAIVQARRAGLDL